MCVCVCVVVLSVSMHTSMYGGALSITATVERNGIGDLG